MGKFEKGNPGKPKGAKNKVNSQMRELIQQLFDDNFDKVQEDLEALEAKDRLKFLSDLLPYLLPKLQSTTHSTKIDLDSMSEEDMDILINRIVNE
jgi:vacuolar-type H+-ATPase subunit E/Vma4